MNILVAKKEPGWDWCVCRCSLGIGIDKYIAWRLTETAAKEIVIAVNNHAALVAALKELLTWFGPARPIENGAECETRSEAIAQAEKALKDAGEL